jgi:hypothetical protein
VLEFDAVLLALLVCSAKGVLTDCYALRKEAPWSCATLLLTARAFLSMVLAVAYGVRAVL